MQITPDNWDRAKELFEAALELDSSQRATFFSENCREESLRQQVEKLLINYEEAGSFLDNPALNSRIPAPNGVTESRDDEASHLDSTSVDLLATATSAEAEDPMVGCHLGAYKLVRRIGQGGMGAVFLASRSDDEYRKQVAVKLVQPGLDSRDLLNRFRNERQTLAGLDHPNIVKLLDGGSTPEGLPFLVMDYVDGIPIDDYCDQHKLPVDERLHLFDKVCAAVQYAHQRMVIHRDLKPSNILVVADGTPKLLDFGIAKVFNPEPSALSLLVTQTGTRCMTPAYASPEQMRGKSVTPATDIYSLGVVLYELLTGHRPYRLTQHTPAEMERAICEQEPETPSTAVNRVESDTSSDGSPITRTPELVSQTREGQPDKLRRRLRGDLDNIVLKALQKEPKRRYGSVEEFALDIDRHLQHQPVKARPSTLPYRVSKFIQRHKTEVSAALIVVLVLVIAGALLYPWIGQRLKRSLRLAELQRLTVVPLTALPGNVASPTFSPDGSQVAFGYDGETNGAGFDLYVKVVGSDKPLRLTYHPSVWLFAAWSPDGRSIAVSRSGGEDDSGIYLVPPTGGPERKLVARSAVPWFANDIGWSPDGKELAYTDVDQDQPSNASAHVWLQLFLLSLDTLEKTRIETNCTSATTPSFSPGGRLLAFVCGETLFSSSLRLLRLKDGTRTQMLSRADHILGVAWSSDERRIVFSSESNYGALWETSLARPSQIEMLPVGHDASDLATAPGSRLAYVQGSTNVNIWRLDLLASPPQVRKLVTSSREQLAPSISPDGSKIAFESTRSGAREIWVCDADGSNAQKVTDFRHTSTGTPRWSPDGKLIAFDSRAGGEANVYVVDPRGGVPHKLNVDMHGNNVPSWSHDGAWIYFVNGEDNHNSTVWKVPPNGGHAVQMATRAAFPLESPDGVYVYFVRDSKLWRVRTDGSKEEQVAGMPQFSSLGDEWFPAEAGIYFLSHANGKTVINLFDLQTRKVQPIFTLEKNTPVWIGGMPVSKDGKFMLYPQVDQSSSDLMLIENWR